MVEKKVNEIATKTEQIELTNPNDIMGFATNLKDLIVQNKLFTPIKGKNYVNVEGWQIAGAFTGTYPIVEKVEELPSKPGEYKYRAEVSLRDRDGQKVGYGVAICSNREPGKGNFDEYAVASMAQTRATGKAFRMKIGWLLKVAGYETTPAEEMDAVQEGEIVKPKTAPEPKKASEAEILRAKTRISTAHGLDELQRIWQGFSPEVQHNRSLIELKDRRKAELLDKPATSGVVTPTRGGEDEE